MPLFLSAYSIGYKFSSLAKNTIKKLTDGGFEQEQILCLLSMSSPENGRIIKKKTNRNLKKLIPNIKRRPRRKGEFCLNCGKELGLDDNYCPNCGQENNHNKASFGTLVVDFFQNYFSLDSKFTNSLLPFFFEPGYLTKKFVAGKRASFVNPVRLYLILSLIFFFVFSMVSSELVEQTTGSSRTAVTRNCSTPG